MWLHLSEANLTSIEISDKDETILASEILKRKYPGRFDLIICDSKKVYSLLKDKKFDLIFIDGDHLFEGVLADIELGLNLGIEWFCFDDYLPEYGPGVQKAISRKLALSPVEIMGNIALYKNILTV